MKTVTEYVTHVLKRLSAGMLETLSYRACSMGGTSQSMVSNLCTASASCLLNDASCPLVPDSLCT